MSKQIQTGEQVDIATHSRQPTRRHEPTGLVVIFDGTCDLCTASVTLLHALDWRRRLRFAPFQRSGLTAAAGLTYAQCEASVWTISPDGRRHSGAAAVCAALDQIAVVPVFSLLYRVPLIARIEEAIYGWVARNRSRLPGLRPYCDDHPDDCANRG